VSLQCHGLSPKVDETLLRMAHGLMGQFVICDSESTGDPVMNMYWIYDLHNWVLCTMIVSVFLVSSLIGLYATRPMVRRLLGPSGHCNDVVRYFFAGIGVLYGLALGLITLSTWQN
jgi:hypothetical protein